MFAIAVSIGIYSYFIFALGLLGFLYKQNIIAFSILYALAIVLTYRYKIIYIIKQIGTIKIPKINLTFALSVLIVLLALVNLIGALGPELGFDALWYHLKFPKTYLNKHIITHIEGGLLYYSDMPKLTEMIYVGALSFGNEILAKLVHFSFGILSLIALYKLSRNFFNQTYSVVTILIFYSNLVVAWQSTTAYIDLARTFFEIMALWGFINWQKKHEKIWIVESAVMLGLAMSTKLIAASSIGIFLLLIIFEHIKYHKARLLFLINDVVMYLIIGLVIALPWFVFSFLNTGNPIYPFFSQIYKVNFDFSLINPLRFVNDIWIIFTRSSDPINPVYVMLLPLVAVYFKNFSKGIKTIIYYSILAIIIWYIAPRTGGGRFMMSYLPAFSIICSAAILVLRKHNFLKNMIIGLVIFLALITMLYRSVANAKYIPVILGKETKGKFLTNNLNFSFGDFYDTDGYFAKNITPSNKVLLYGFHNLYYVDFPFIDSSWVKKGDVFDYIAVQNSELPKRFSYWNLVYYNKKTNVKLYSLGGQKWVY